MDGTMVERVQRLHQIEAKTEAAAAAFQSEYGETLDAYRHEISEGIPHALAELRKAVRTASLDNEVCEQLVEQAAVYVDWLQWSLWDLPFYAVAMQPQPAHFRRAATACGFVYLSIRVFDDAIDRHFWYKGRHPSLLAATTEITPNSQGVEGLTILAGLLLCFNGLSQFLDPEQPHLVQILQPVIQAVQRTVIGAIMENSEATDWDRTYYDRLVELKNVEYWRSLYACVDPAYASPLYPFLEKYYTLAQYLNDVQDFAEDQARGQPNLLSLYLAPELDPASRFTPPVNGTDAGLGGPVAPADAQAFLADVFIELDDMADALPTRERLIAQLKLHESLVAAYRYGLFEPMAASEPDDGQVPERWADIRLDWHSTAEDVVAQAGSQALVEVNCGVCGASERSYLFRKDGFAYHRCMECSHIYVSPRISAELQVHIGDMVDMSDEKDIYLDVQKLYASSLCNLLRTQAPGKRLLDIGFGSGYLAELAQAYGFEIFGADSSPVKVDALWPRWGHRLLQVVMGRDEIPWHSFDVVIMSHVIEHLPDPRATLLEVHSLMNPGALLYVAVPDMDSLPFHIFGKRWDVINPLVHFQYFNRDSLETLLRSCGFAALEQVEHPQKPSMLASSWDRLMRELTGSESTELSILARADKPHDADADDG